MSNPNFNLPPISQPGQRVTLPPETLIPQPRLVFTHESYRDFIQYFVQIRREEADLIQRHGRHKNPQVDAKLEELGCQYRELMPTEYIRRLPNYVVAVCPYCGITICQPVDIFSLLAFSTWLNVIKFYIGSQEVYRPPRQWCRHAVMTIPAINLNGLCPDDLPNWAGAGHFPGQIHSSPALLVWLLVARQTSAVVHAAPVGRLNDPKLIHRYTAYYVTYFAGPESNLHTPAMWVPDDLGGPATGAVFHDTNLLKWMRAGRLYWLNPNNPAKLLQGPVEAFPYANIQPQGWYDNAPSGWRQGPQSFGRLWEGAAPPHDQSFSKTVE
jgi:hypothetical protein